MENFPRRGYLRGKKDLRGGLSSGTTLLENKNQAISQRKTSLKLTLPRILQEVISTARGEMMRKRGPRHLEGEYYRGSRANPAYI